MAAVADPPADAMLSDVEDEDSVTADPAPVSETV
jgi:hypothetical protein